MSARVIAFASNFSPASGSARLLTVETGRQIRAGFIGAAPGLPAWIAPGDYVFAQDRALDWSFHMHPMWGMWGIGMMLMMLVFWAAVTAGLVVAIRWLVSQGRQSPSDTALRILRERYARGEIDREEFEAKKRDLS
jgi:putative membrane protein